MGAGKNKFTVSTGLVRLLNTYAENQAVDFKVVADSCDFDIGLLDNDTARISIQTFESMWQKIISLSGDPHPGLNFGRQMGQHYPSGSILFTMMMNCRTIEKALQTFVRYHQIMADFIQPRVQKSEETTHLSWDILAYEFHATPHLSEALLCTYYSILNFLGKGTLVPVNVSFMHAAPGDAVKLEEYRRTFNAPVLFGRDKNELVIETEVLGLTINFASRELYTVLEQHAARVVKTLPIEKKWSSEVMVTISDMMIRGEQPGIESVARRLAVGKRTLQGRLRTEETCFRMLLENTRKQMAIDTLSRQDISICDIAFMLGYSDQSAFNHAFKRWTGRTPKAYSKKNG